ncbi:MAG: sulfite exporter TauE/SafE family protein [Gammaproteobacteria bacterium]|nr:sulfite exporter TauE/SafE family protein [Gammaproteobacteria bacterium]
MIDATTLVILATFLLAGLVKGVIGLGLPTVSLAILTVALDLPSAMALLLVPSFITNLWQAMVGGNTRLILARIWPFLLMATATIWIGAQALKHVQLSMLSALLGVLLAAYAIASLVGFRLSLSPRRASWGGALLGIVNGIFTGMTGSFVVPGVIYLQALGFSRDALIQAMGMLFALSTLALGLALQSNNMLASAQIIDSSIALLPAIAGMMLGQRIRSRISEPLFRKVFFVSLLALGAYIIVSAPGF